MWWKVIDLSETRSVERVGVEFSSGRVQAVVKGS